MIFYKHRSWEERRHQMSNLLNSNEKYHVSHHKMASLSSILWLSSIQNLLEDDDNEDDLSLSSPNINESSDSDVIVPKRNRHHQSSRLSTRKPSTAWSLSPLLSFAKRCATHITPEKKIVIEDMKSRGKLLPLLIKYWSNENNTALHYCYCTAKVLLFCGVCCAEEMTFYPPWNCFQAVQSKKFSSDVLFYFAVCIVCRNCPFIHRNSVFRIKTL